MKDEKAQITLLQRVDQNCQENRAEIKRLYDTLYNVYQDKLDDPQKYMLLDLADIVKSLVELSKQLTSVEIGRAHV